MILPVHHQIRRHVAATLSSLYGLAPEDQPTLAIEIPPVRRFGDLASPFAFELARRLRKAPRAIAQEVVAALGPIAGVARVEAAPNGYVNVFLDRAAFLTSRLAAPVGADASLPSPIPREKTIVEHTAINPNKAAHIGHLRNSSLGDTLVRLLRFMSVPVEVQNYIDDTGVQVADVVVGFMHLEGKTLDEVRQIAGETRFDYHCWDLYARVTEWYEADKSRLAVRAETLHAIEHGTGDAAAMGHVIAEHIVACHLRTMARLNIDYDLLTWEGDILRLKFWATAFDILKANGSVFLQEEGRLAGCWVMRIDEDAPATSTGPAAAGDATTGTAAVAADAATSTAAPDNTESPATAAPEPSPDAIVDGDEAADAEQREKVIVRSNGTVTYVGKDIAYQFWKMGLLGKDFHYREFARRLDGAPLWATTSDERAARGGVPPVPSFGGAHATYNVIDTRQSYLQKLLKQALFVMGHRQEAERSTHFAYEMVALTHATARELGYEVSDQADRPFVEVSGRKGLGVKADDLLDRLTEKALSEVARRNEDIGAAGQRRIAEQIAVAALRYFMVKFTRNKVIAFDIDEALSFEGESGPYLQYAAVRAQNIFGKLRDRLGLDEGTVVEGLARADRDAIEGDESDEVWDMVLQCARLDEVVEQSLRTLELSLLAKYAFGLAQSFNGFYHRYQILNEEREGARLWRAAVAAYFLRQISRALDLMGSAVPERM